MDLCERDPDSGARHPWELARVAAVERLLGHAVSVANPRILDVGCGDGYVGKRVRAALAGRELIGVDAHLDAVTARTLSGPDETFVNSPEDVEGTFDVVLFLDVIEHVEDDAALLREILAKHSTRDTRVLVTVPAFQSLFSRHDVFLRHFRRYSLGELRDTLDRAGLEPTSSGYLFGSLLAPRAVSRLREKFLSPTGPATGAGRWRAGSRVTRTIARTLDLENRCMMALARRGVRLPGLTAWALSTPRPS